jgi:hypothetical protein
VCGGGGLFEGTRERKERKRESLKMNNTGIHFIHVGRWHKETH